MGRADAGRGEGDRTRRGAEDGLGSSNPHQRLSFPTQQVAHRSIGEVLVARRRAWPPPPCKANSLFFDFAFSVGPVRTFHNLIWERLPFRTPVLCGLLYGPGHIWSGWRVAGSEACLTDLSDQPHPVFAVAPGRTKPNRLELQRWSWARIGCGPLDSFIEHAARVASNPQEDHAGADHEISRGRRILGG